LLHSSVLADAISLSPNTTLPGTATIQSLLGGIMTVALYICAAAMAFGGGAWAFGQRAGNLSASHRGRELVIGAFFGAFLIGAIQLIVNFAFSTGQGAH